MEPLIWVRWDERPCILHNIYMCIDCCGLKRKLHAQDRETKQMTQ